MRRRRRRPTIQLMNVLVTAATRHGATLEIAEAIADVLRRRGLDVVVLAPHDVRSVEDYDAVVVGSAVYTGRWLKPATELVERSARELSARPVWLFSSGPVGDPSRKLVQKMGVDPVDLPALREMTHAQGHHMFAGRLEKQNLTRPQRAALTLFPGLHGDFRDWKEIERWAVRIADSLQSRVGAAQLARADQTWRAPRESGEAHVASGDPDPLT
jgi:menaquinone-dependent protoporphyrinogen oxidase